MTEREAFERAMTLVYHFTAFLEKFPEESERLEVIETEIKELEKVL